MKLTLIAAADEQPITLNEAKQFLRVDTSADDRLISRLIRAATSQCEAYCGRSFVAATYGIDFHAQSDGVYSVRIDQSPIQTITVEALDEMDLDIDPAYEISDDILYIDLPGGVDVRVRARVGIAESAEDLPTGILTAIEGLVAHWYETRETADMPEGIRRLLNPFRRVVLAS